MASRLGSLKLQAASAFRCTCEDFRKAVQTFAPKADDKIWESDLELLVELGLGPEARKEKGWRAFEEPRRTLDDGLILLDTISDWIRSRLEESCSLRSDTRDQMLTEDTCSSTSDGETMQPGAHPYTEDLYPSVHCKPEIPVPNPWSKRSKFAEDACSGPVYSGSCADNDPDVQRRTSGQQGTNPSRFFSLVKAFSMYDSDSNGVICAKDLRNALSHLTGETPSLQDCKRMIQRVDANNDGVVDLLEFVEMMRAPRARAMA